MYFLIFYHVFVFLLILSTSTGHGEASKSLELITLQRVRRYIQVGPDDRIQSINDLDRLLDNCGTPMCMYTKAVVSFEIKKEQPGVAEGYIRSAVRQDRETFFPALVWILIEKGDNDKAFNLILQIRDSPNARIDAEKGQVYSIPSLDQLFVRLCKNYDDISGICDLKMQNITRLYL